MAIRFKATITYRDDKTKTFDCSAHPSQSDSYWCIETSSDDRQYIPKEVIKTVVVKDYWKK